MVDGPSASPDVVCACCGRHNREERVVIDDAGPVVCQVGLATCAEIFDSEVGLAGPAGGGTARWPLKTELAP